MNYTAILEALRKASAFELFRLRAAIDRALRDPARNDAIRRCLQRGQQVEYFDVRENRTRDGHVVELRPATVVILDREAATHFLIDYAAINLDGADAVIRERTERGIGRQEIAVGDLVGFQDRDGRQRHGTVARLNGKTVTLDCDGVPWRVSYALLHRMIDADAP